MVLTGEKKAEMLSAPCEKRSHEYYEQHYHWSFHFVVGVLSLSIGSVLGLTAAYQSLQRVLS